MKNCYCLLLILLAILASLRPAHAQQQITAIGVSGSALPTVTYYNVKGAGLRKPDNTLRSSWDSSGTNFTVKFNATAANNLLTVTQYTVNGIVTPVIKMPANAVVKLRRQSNTYVNDTRNHYNFWATYSTIPAALATSGTFNFIAPEVLAPEDAFLLNNITSGYDNIFENTITNLHASNIERLDFIIPEGMRAVNLTDLTNSGIAVFDRGSGDPFKIAAITGLNASGDPVSYGNLVSVTAANFGAGLLSSSFDFCIITRDPKFKNQSRPSSPDNQNLRGVYISLSDLGLATNQSFYGYSLFGPDVISANPDWTTYPSGTSTTSGLDPVNIMGLYKTTYSVLSVPVNFSAMKHGDKAKLEFTLYNKISNHEVVIEKSKDGFNYSSIDTIVVTKTGLHEYFDMKGLEGNNFYRLKLFENDGSSGYSDIRTVSFESASRVNVFPNPASEKINFSFPKNLQSKSLVVSLIDSHGRIILKQNFNRPNPTESINVSKFPAGFYNLLVTELNGEAISSCKIIFQ